VNCGGAGRIEIAFRSRASLVPGLEESAEAPCSCLGFFFCVCVLRPRFCWMFCDANQEESRQSIVNSFALLPFFIFIFYVWRFISSTKGQKFIG
jgi:amino acid permease